MENKQLKIVYNITERGDRSYWNRIGVAYENRDGSLNIKLDAIPVNGSMQVRDWTPREDAAGSESSRPKGNGSSRSASSQGVEDFPTNF